jgi:hypothetical protein
MLGDISCLVLIISSLCTTYYLVLRNNTPASLFQSQESSIPKTLNYLDTVHMKLYNYVPFFFAAFLVARLNRTGFVFVKNLEGAKLARWSAFSFLFLQMLVHADGLHNTFRIFSTDNSIVAAPYLVCVKVGFILWCVLNMLLLESMAAQSKKGKNGKGIAKVEQSSIPSSPIYGFWRGMSRLSFAMYFSNYLYIRSEFFMSRTTFEHNVFCFLKREGIAIIMLPVVAFVFHLFVVAPFEQLRRLLMASPGHQVLAEDAAIVEKTKVTT